MKKYSDEHLESVPPEYIWAVEKSINIIKSSQDLCSYQSCMAVILDDEFPFHDYCYHRKIHWCPQYMGYTYEKSECPCYEFGITKSLSMMKNLVKQWKSWAGVE